MDFDVLMMEIQLYELERTSGFASATTEEIRKTWNGIGPAWMPVYARNLLTRAYRIFAAACLIHDWEFVTLHRDEFTVSNRRMRRNMMTLARSRRDLWYPVWYIRAWYLWAACQFFGRSAWEAHR